MSINNQHFVFYAIVMYSGVFQYFGFPMQLFILLYKRRQSSTQFLLIDVARGNPVFDQCQSVLLFFYCLNVKCDYKRLNGPAVRVLAHI